MNTDIKLFTDEEMKAMGKRIQNARKKKGFKALDFADIIGIGKDQLSRIENGKVPCKVEYVYVIVQYLDVTADYILYGKKSNDSFIEMASRLDDKQMEKVIKIMQLIFDE